MNGKINLNCWKENIEMLAQICRDLGVTEYETEELFTDAEGDTLYEFKSECNWTPEAWDHYQKNRIRK